MSTPSDVAGRLADVEATLSHLMDRVRADREQTADAVEAIVRTLEDRHDATGLPPSTAPVGDPDDEPVAWIARATVQDWTHLADWVDWLVATYGIREDEHAIYACWPSHLGVAEELAAIWSAWRRAAVAVIDEDPDALAYWHDRYLAPTLHRIKSQYTIRNCKSGHQDVAAVEACTDRSRLHGNM